MALFVERARSADARFEGRGDTAVLLTADDEVVGCVDDPPREFARNVFDEAGLLALAEAMPEELRARALKQALGLACRELAMWAVAQTSSD